MLFIMNHIFNGKTTTKGLLLQRHRATLGRTDDFRLFFFFLFLLQDTGTLWAWQRADHVPDRTLFSDQNTHGCTTGRNYIGNFTSHLIGMLLFVLLIGQRGWVTGEILRSQRAIEVGVLSLHLQVIMGTVKDFGHGFPVASRRGKINKIEKPSPDTINKVQSFRRLNPQK